MESFDTMFKELVPYKNALITAVSQGNFAAWADVIQEHAIRKERLLSTVCAYLLYRKTGTISEINVPKNFESCFPLQWIRQLYEQSLVP
jgi:hypothetical protein